MILKDAIDICEVKRLCEAFSSLTGAAIGILDLDGEILVATGWQPICTGFHRANPETAALCRKSDTVLAGSNGKGAAYHLYTCENGLVDVAVPIVIAGVHVANFFTGQFLTTPPDLEFFARQAARYGFDREDYLKALDRVPVVGEGDVRAIMDFFTRFARLIGEMGLARERLREEANLRAALFEHSPDAIVIVDPKTGGFVDFNTAAHSLLGYSREEFASLTIFDVEAAERREDISMRLAAIVAGGGGDFESIHRTRTGELRDVQVRAQMVNIGGEPVCYAVYRDVTVRNREARERESLREQLLQAQKMEALGTLAGGIAHDFNNILGAVIGYTELSLSGLPDECEAREHLREVLKAGARARDLVSQILTFCRKNLETPQPILIEPVLKEAVKLLRATIPSNVSITVVSSGEQLPPALATPTQIHQIAMNLGANAYHAFGGSAGTISYAVRKDIVTGVRAERLGVKPGNFLIVSVEDDGRGIDHSHLPNIFDPFFTTKPAGEGTGLGLSVVHGIARANGGGVEVETRQGKGTVFSIYLPEAPTAAGEQAEYLPPEWRDAQGSVVVLDDEPALAKLIAKSMANRGMKTRYFTKPEEALQLLLAEPDGWDLLITDQTMPEMTGSELFLRARAEGLALPVIVCTGHSDVLSPDQAQEMGFSAYMSKPVSLSELYEKVMEVLGVAQDSPPKG